MNINKRYMSTIMAIMGSIGVASSIVLAVKATPDAVNKIHEDSCKHHEGDPDLYTKVEAIKSAWKYYVLPGTIGIATVSCIWGLTALNRYPKMDLSSAYLMINEARKKYIQDLKNSGIATLDEEKTEIPEDQTLFFDITSGRYFNSTLYQVKAAEYDLNRKFATEGEATLNDFYDFLGIDRIMEGDDKGWSIIAGLEFGDCLWVDFEHTMVNTDDGLKCCLITAGYCYY